MPTHPPEPLLDRVRRFLDRRRDALGAGVVVAVSGGGDSVGLLRILHALAPEVGLELTVAHLDHGARPESAADARFVAELAAALDLPFALGHWAPRRSSHFEADARTARYDWLAQVAREQGASAIAVGHTRDDQAETILHRIVRGTGLRGLSGMPSRRRLSGSLTLVRPLLVTTRAEIRAYLAALDQPYREDPTNTDTARTRARIRHNLLPRLADEYNPKVAEALVRLGQIAGSEQRRRERTRSRRVEEALFESGPNTIVLLITVLNRLPTAERVEVIRLAWRQCRWPEGAMTARHWRRWPRV